MYFRLGCRSFIWLLAALDAGAVHVTHNFGHFSAHVLVGLDSIEDRDGHKMISELPYREVHKHELVS
jgi:hypothetical protein